MNVYLSRTPRASRNRARGDRIWDEVHEMEGHQVRSSPRRRADAPTPAHARGFRVSMLGACIGVLGLFVLSLPVVAFAAGPDAILTPTGYAANPVARGDDTANQVVGLPFSMNWNGTSYNQVFINMNGNVTFGNGFTGFDPNTTLQAAGQNIMAPFWADVDTRNAAMGQVTYSNITAGSVPQVDGQDAFFVNWINVGRYNYTSANATQTNSFQLVIVDRSDTGAGNFDFMYNYDAVAWDIATGSSNRRARVGWGRSDGTGFELPGSGTAQGSTSTLLDISPAATSLIQNEMNDADQLGRYVWQVRGGTVPNTPPVVTAVDRVLEGNAPGVYAGYTGTGDVTAIDPDGLITSLVRSGLSLLPIGGNSLVWTATDDRATVATASQTVTVADTVAPTLPTLTSPTHTASVWTNVSDVTVNSAISTDTCTGVSGTSYIWSLNSAVTPDTTFDASTASTLTVPVTTTETVTYNEQTFPTTTWPTDWTRSDATYARIATTAGRYRLAAYAAEVWANSNNRRTVSFYKTYDLSAYTAATLSFFDDRSAFSNNQDYALVEYSTNNGANWTQLKRDTGTSTATLWTWHQYALPAVANLRVRFSASVNSNAEYANWDEILVQGVLPTTTNLSNAARSVTATSTLGDGTWYFNLRTRDVAGNWTGTRSFGPVLIDSGPPLTTDNAPSTWSTATVNVSLTATDTGSGVAYTRYKLDAAAVATYTAAVPVSTDGTHTLQYWSVDNRGNVEATKTATVRVDKTAPTVPGGFSASSVSTSSVEMTWTVSTDAVSGMLAYGVYRDGSLLATSSATTYTATGLNPGQTYAFSVAALDVAGNWSPRTASVNETLPFSEIWMELSPTSFDFGSMDPGTSSAISSGTVVTVGGVGLLNYDLTCSAQDFSNATTLTTTPTMPAGYMTYATRGWTLTPVTPFTTSSTLVSTGVGTNYVWQHPYVFDYVLDMPWTYEPGVYTTSIRFTAVSR